MNSAALLFLPLGLVGLNLYALLLVLLRGPLFGTTLYRPMVLNIALSISPAVVMALVLVALVLVVAVAPSSASVWAVLVVGAVLWLLMLPNAAYLVTELNLSHRRPADVETVPLWYDIVLVLTLAMSGVLNTLANVAIAQLAYAAVVNDTVEQARRDPGAWVLAGAVLLLVAFGIYLGRYIRFNSWDLLHPTSFARKLRGHFRVRANRLAALGFVLTHGVFLAILYLVVAVPAVVLVLY